MDLDDDELRATRKMHGQDDGLYEETSDKNVVSEDDMEELYDVLLHHRETGEVRIAIKHLLAEREQMLNERKKYTIRLTDEEYRKVIENAQMDTSNDRAIAIKFVVMQQQIDEKERKIIELENGRKPWDKIMTAERMTLEEAINIVDEMYQDRYKIIEEKTEEETTIHLEKIDDVKFTNLEFASVRLLREVQSLQKKLESSTLEQKIEGEIQVHLNYLNNQALTSNPILDKHFREKERYVIQVLRKLSEGENKNV